MGAWSKTRKLTIHKRENALERGWFRGRVKGGRVEEWEGEVEEWRSGRGAGGNVGSPTFEFDLSGYMKFDQIG